MDQSRDFLEEGNPNENLILVCDTGFLSEFIFKDTEKPEGVITQDLYQSALDNDILSDKEAKNLNQLKEKLSSLEVDFRVYIKPSEAVGDEVSFFRKLGWQICHRLKDVKVPEKKVVFFSKKEVIKSEDRESVDLQLIMSFRRRPVSIWRKTLKTRKDIKSELDIAFVKPTVTKGPVLRLPKLPAVTFAQVMKQAEQLNELNEDYYESAGKDRPVNYKVFLRSKPTATGR